MHNTDLPPLESAALRKRLATLAWFLDSSITLPGGWRVGADAAIGLIPVVGDVIGALLSSYILASAAQLHIPRTVMLRMGLNVLIETVVGAIPFFGDLFDAGWKANRRNVRLIEAALAEPRRSARHNGWVLAGIGAAAFATVVGISAALIWLLAIIWRAVT